MNSLSDLQGLPEDLKDALIGEADTWRGTAMPSTMLQTGTRAWLVLDSEALALIDLISFAPSARWTAWTDAASREIERLAGPDVTLDGRGQSLLGPLLAFPEYELDLPGTPAEWRSVSNFETQSSERMTTLRALSEDLSIGLAIAASNSDPDVSPESTDSHEARSNKISELVEQFRGLRTDELQSYVTAFEETFGVDVSSTPARGPETEDANDVAGENDEFAVILAVVGDKKIQVIREVRAITSLGLGEARALVDEAPRAVLEGANKEDAARAKETLEAAGAIVAVGRPIDIHPAMPDDHPRQQA